MVLQTNRIAARLVLGAAVLVAFVVGINVPSITFPSKLDHSMTSLTLSSSAGSNVHFKLITAPYSTPGSPNAGLAAGSLQAPAGWEPITTFATGIHDVSKQLYRDNSEKKYNAQALFKKDIFPNYGDLPGEWLVQHGQENWVMMELPETHDLNQVIIWETFNPGGISLVEISSKTGNRKVIYQTGWPTATNAREASGANQMTLTFDPVPFDAHYITIQVDATEKWRGIDAFTVSGFVRKEASIPGDIYGNQLTFVPNPSKPFGCDEFKYAAENGGGWSDPGVIKFCYSCALGNGNQVCSGRGNCQNAVCQCNQGWSGQACDVPLCPLYNGQMCSNRGSCVGNTCQCPAGYQGNACEVAGVSRYCYACNDPHYVSFWGRYFNLYSTGEWLLHWWPAGGMKNLQVNMYVWVLYVDGASVRYGHDIVTWGWRSYGDRLLINCNDVGPGWYHFPTGMSAYLSSGYFQVVIGDWFNYWMNTGCFGITTLTAYGQAYGMCNDNDYWNIPGGCSLWNCQRCGADNQLTMLKTSEKISPKKIGAKVSIPHKELATFFIGEGKEKKLNIDALKVPEPGRNDWPTGVHVGDGKYNAGLERDGLMTLTAEKDAEIGNLRGVGSKNSKRKFRSPTEKYMINFVALYALDPEVSAKAAGEATEVNQNIKTCPSEILKKCMTLDTCLKHLGTARFDDCVLDACLLAKQMPHDQAVAEANKENNAAQTASNIMHDSVKIERAEVAKADTENKAEHQ